MFESLPLPQNDGASFTELLQRRPWIGEVHLIGNEVGTESMTASSSPAHEGRSIE